MKVLVLGGAGRIAREAALDLAVYGFFSRITLADINGEAAAEVAKWINHTHVDSVELDIRDEQRALEYLREYDLVMDATTISLNETATRLIGLAGCHGVNLNGFGAEYAFDDMFRHHGKIMIPGFGMTPGITNMMAKWVCDLLEEVDTVRISHGAFRPVAFSRSIAETTLYEYDDNLPSRVVYENGKMIQVKPFARPLEVQLPEPYGKTLQFIIPHSETQTLADYLSNKNVKLIEVRGTWPEPNMRLLRALYDFGFLSNEKINIGQNQIGIMDVIGEYLVQSRSGKETELYGYALHVEITGKFEGKSVRHTLTHTHPPSDGSEKEWTALRAYTRNVGIPFAIAGHLIATDRFEGRGVCIPERAFEPGGVFMELARRGIMVHEKIVS
jgi:saccharopine dehydrogenase-like NADP-dependent oxidoreductase